MSISCCYWCCCFCVFFFKQKTAYEMRISDWSSDVCSSDLLAQHPGGGLGVLAAAAQRRDRVAPAVGIGVAQQPFEFAARAAQAVLAQRQGGIGRAHGRGPRRAAVPQLQCFPGAGVVRARQRNAGGALRSEEHTSELQSLMRISYAVFCLKKKNNTNYKTLH